MAELNRRRKEHDAARELLDHVWPLAERGPYPLLHADVCNILAQLERDLAYHYGLTNAKKHLQELGAPEPQLPPFDESRFPPMPDVELNPDDEFHV